MTWKVFCYPFPPPLWNLNFYCRVATFLRLYQILRQFNPFQTHISYFRIIHLINVSSQFVSLADFPFKLSILNYLRVHPSHHHWFDYLHKFEVYISCKSYPASTCYVSSRRSKITLNYHSLRQCESMLILSSDTGLLSHHINKN
jgi:hypothetical protein